MEEKINTNIFIQFIKSFYSFKDYPSFAKSKGGKIFLYVLIMVCITYVLTLVIPLSRLPEPDESLIDDYVPYFEISGGKFYIERDLFYEDETGTMLIMAVSEPFKDSGIDMDMIKEKYTDAIIITQDLVFMIQANYPAINQYDFSNVSYFSRDSLYELIPVLKTAVLIICILLFICYIAAFLIGTLVCSVIGVFINRFVKANVGFGSIFKLTVYARTAPVIIKTLLSSFFGLSVPAFAFYGFFGVFIYMALRAVKDEESQNYGDEFIYPDDAVN